MLKIPHKYRRIFICETNKEIKIDKLLSSCIYRAYPVIQLDFILIYRNYYAENTA